MSGADDLLCRGSFFPDSLFRICVDPVALRGFATDHGRYARDLGATDRELARLDLSGWVGVEGDTFRRTRSAYRPMLGVAHEAFGEVATAVDHLASVVEGVVRRMTVVRAEAWSTWSRLEVARAGGPLPELSTGAMHPRLGTTDAHLLNPEAGLLQTRYRELVRQADALHEEVRLAADAAAAAIGRTPTPPTIPMDGADVFGPRVVARERTEYDATGTVRFVDGTASYRTELEQMSDGTWRVRLRVGAAAGVTASAEAPGLEPDTPRADGQERTELPDGSPVGVTGPADASVSVGATGAVDTELVWTARTREEAEATMAEVRKALLLSVFLSPAHLLRRVRPDAAGVGFEAKVEAEAEARAGATTAGAQAHGRVGVRTQVDRKGVTTTSFSLDGSATAEHPDVRDPRSQKAYGGAGAVTATVTLTRDGRGTLVVSTRTQKAGENTFRQVDRSRLLTPAEVEHFRNAPKDILSGRVGAGTHGYQALRTIAETAQLESSSPEVRNGTADRVETVWSVEETEDDLPGLEVADYGVELGHRETRETLVSSRRG